MRNAPRRRFDEQFRREAVRLAESGTVPIAQVARELGVHVATLWKRSGSGGSKPGRGRRRPAATRRCRRSRKRTADCGARMRGSWRSARS
ncbi:MAG: transposase [Gemmatimonadaceae bacterium]